MNLGSLAEIIGSLGRLRGPDRLVVTSFIVAGLIMLTAFAAYHRGQPWSSSPLPVEITNASLIQYADGNISAKALVRNSGTQPITVSGRVDGLYFSQMSFQPTEIMPGETANGLSVSAPRVARFDGQTSSVRVPTNPNLNSGSFTLEFAFEYSNLQPDQQMLVGKGAAGGDSFYFYTFRSANNVNDLVVYKDSTRYDFQLGDIFEVGRWYVVAFVVDFEGVYAYINGVMTRHWESGVSFGGNQHDLVVGSCYCGGYHFNGSLGFLRFYDRALPDSELSVNYSTHFPSLAGLVMWLDFGSAANGEVKDLSGNGNDGTISGLLSMEHFVLTCDLYVVTVTASANQGARHSVSREIKPENC